MPKFVLGSGTDKLGTRFSARSFLCACALIALFFQTGCLFRKSKPAVGLANPIRLVILPFSVPADKQDLRWTAMAAPILATKAAEHSKDLQITPLSESMAPAIEAAGASRSLNAESAATIAAWLGAKWTVMGELTPLSGSRASIVIDFIPAKSNQVSFRYMRTGRIDLLGMDFRSAYSQFLRYIAASPLQPRRKREPSAGSVKELAEALDREYGWSVEAQPGKAHESVNELMKTDPDLARKLFSSTLYPSLAENR